MSNEERLQRLMQRGWNITIECKSIGRVYAMTYEASAHKVPAEDTTTEGLIQAFYSAHALGNTMDELVTNLENNISIRETGSGIFYGDQGIL
jgi:hypothetical protein